MAGPTTTATIWILLLLLFCCSAAAGGETPVTLPLHTLYVRNEGSVNGNHNVSFSCSLNTSSAGVVWTHAFSLRPGLQIIMFDEYDDNVDFRLDVARMRIRGLGPGEIATVDCAFDAGDGCGDRFVLFDSRSAFHRSCAQSGCLYTVRDGYLKVRPLCPGSVEMWRFWQVVHERNEFWFTNYRSLPYAVPAMQPSPSPSHRYNTTSHVRCARKRFQRSSSTGHSYEQGCIPEFKITEPSYLELPDLRLTRYL